MIEDKFHMWKVWGSAPLSGDPLNKEDNSGLDELTVWLNMSRTGPWSEVAEQKKQQMPLSCPSASLHQCYFPSYHHHPFPVSEPHCGQDATQKQTIVLK